EEIIDRTLKVDNEEMMHQIVEKVLWENVEKLFKLDYDEFIQTCIWRPKKEDKQENISVEWFVLQMGAIYGHEVLENQQLIKKALDRKKKSKEKKSKNIKNLLQSNDSLSLDEDEIANIKNIESQKLAKKWLKNYIKNLCDAPKKDKTIISHLWKDATTHAQKTCPSISKADITRSSDASTRHNDYLNVLDKIADSIYLKLSDLLSKLSKLNVEYRNGIYKLIVRAQKYKPDITILKQYIFQYNLESECEALIDF
ncbi:8211_t:CDS:2, partial [Ambispora gerdemannii]